MLVDGNALQLFCPRFIFVHSTVAFLFSFHQQSTQFWYSRWFWVLMTFVLFLEEHGHCIIFAALHSPVLKNVRKTTAQQSYLICRAWINFAPQHSVSHRRSVSEMTYNVTSVTLSLYSLTDTFHYATEEAAVASPPLHHSVAFWNVFGALYAKQDDRCDTRSVVSGKQMSTATILQPSYQRHYHSLQQQHLTSQVYLTVLVCFSIVFVPTFAAAN